MDLDQWAEVERILDRLVDLEPEERELALSKISGDQRVLDEVRSLLRAGARPPHFLSGHAAEFAAPAMMEPESSPGEIVDRRIGPYSIIRELGHGGMGIVYLAERQDVGKRVALKLVRDRAADQAYLGRFLFERQILARLEHPNIAQLVDAGVADDGTPWFAMEYVDGTPITRHCKDHGLDVAERLEIFLVVCAAVQHAHRHLVVHRDLKPSNILVGGDGRVKLLDFGIAKFLDSESGGPATTQAGLRVMTPAYGSPEQAMGLSITTLSDIYSLGVLLYELLTDTRPYPTEGLSQTELLRNICDTIPLSPSTAVRRLEEGARLSIGVRRDELVRSLAGDLDTIVMKALRKEPDRRYVSVEAFADDIRRYLAREPVSARPATVGYRSGKFIRRNRIPVAVAAGVSVLVALFATFYAVRITAERDRAESEARRATQVADFLVDLFAASDPSEAAGDSISVADLLARGEKRLRQLASEPLLQARMLETVGKVRLSLGHFAVAESLLSQAHDVYASSLGPLSPEALAASLLLAGALSESGDYARALQIQRSAADAIERSPGAYQPEQSIDALIAIGLSHRRLSQFDSAETFYRQALFMNRELAPPDSGRLGANLDNLGVVLGIQGKYDEARPFFEESLAIGIARHGEIHPSVASNLSNLATLSSRIGDLDRSDSLQHRILEIRRRLYPAGHPELGLTLSDLGYIKSQRGDLAAALDLYTEAMEVARRFYGSSHPEVATEISNVATTYFDLGQYEQAERMAREALDMRRTTLGEHHQSVGRSLNRIGQIRLARGDHGEAIRLQNESLAIRVALFGPSHREIAESLDDLGLAEAAAGRFDSAERHLREAYDIRRSLYNNDHPLVRESKEHIERFLVQQGIQIDSRLSKPHLSGK